LRLTSSQRLYLRKPWGLERVGQQGEHREITAEATAEMLANASSVVITPGYGMAAAQASAPLPNSPTSSARRASTSGSASTQSPGACPGT
jgi:NAD/NADP transhydrogenase beta subunit